VKANEVGRACGTYWRGEKSIQDLLGKSEGKRPSEDRGVGGKMGTEWILWRVAGGGCRLDSTGSG
jgi:hypothetical protein